MALTNETTRFANFGPLMGQTFRLSVGKFFKIFSKSLDAYNLEGEFRKYLRLDNYTLLAFRLSGFYSGGKNAMLFWSGGNNTLRGAEFRSLVGNKGFFLNAEFRFALVHAALTPIGIIGPVRGVFFFDMGGLWFNEQKFRIFEPGSHAAAGRDFLLRLRHRVLPVRLPLSFRMGLEDQFQGKAVQRRQFLDRLRFLVPQGDAAHVQGRRLPQGDAAHVQPGDSARSWQLTLSGKDAKMKRAE